MGSNKMSPSWYEYRYYNSHRIGGIHVSLQQNLSNFMNTIRLSRNQSITEFAEEIAVSSSEMQHILKGTCNPRIDTLKNISNTLDVDTANIFLLYYTTPRKVFSLI